MWVECSLFFFFLSAYRALGYYFIISISISTNLIQYLWTSYCGFFFYPSTLCEIFNKQYLERGPRYAKHNEQQLVAAERAQGLISGPEHAKAPHACKSVPFEKCLQKYLVRCPPIKRTKINMSPFIAAGSADTAARAFFFFFNVFLDASECQRQGSATNTAFTTRRKFWNPDLRFGEKRLERKVGSDFLLRGSRGKFEPRVAGLNATLMAASTAHGNTMMLFTVIQSLQLDTVCDTFGFCT